MKRLRPACLLIVLFGVAAAAFGERVHELSGAGDLAGLKALLAEEPGAVREVDGRGRTALHAAAEKGEAEAVEMLLLAGAEADARDSKRRTALHLAAFRGQAEAARVLLKHGASRDVVDTTGKRPIDAAAARGRRELVNILLEAETARLSGCVHRITPAYSTRINIVVSAGADGVLVVDSGEAETGAGLREAIEALGHGGPRYVINTHKHAPHIAGNADVARGAETIGYEDLERLEKAGVLKRGERPLRGYGERLFDEYYTLRFNGEEVRLIHASGGHTEHDLIVQFAGAGVVAMQDLLDSQSFPPCGGHVQRYFEILDAAIAAFPAGTRFVAGHGRAMGLDELREYRETLWAATEAVLAGMRSGKSAEEMRREGVLKKWEWLGEFIPQLGTDYWVGAVLQSWE